MPPKGKGGKGGGKGGKGAEGGEKEKGGGITSIKVMYFVNFIKRCLCNFLYRPRGLLVSSSYGTSSHIKGNSTLCSYAEWYCKWVSAAVRCSYCA